MTRTGLGMLAGVAALALLPALRAAGPCAGAATDRVQPTVGPFTCAVERTALRPDAHGRTRAYVQFRLDRLGGPVPLPERIRVDGEAELGPDWVPVSTEWMIRNELVQWPAGEWLEHPVLGRVPATIHAGQVRAVFEFQWVGEGCPARAPMDLTFRLPDGRSITLQNLQRR